MENQRPWQSRTMWVNFVAGLAAIAVLFGVDLDLDAETQTRLVAGIMVVVNAVNIVLRKVSTKKITMKDA